MQAVVLAAGASSRLFPLSKDTHKSMISLCGKPLLAWTLSALKKVGIKDVVVVTSPSDKKIHKFLAHSGLKVKKVLQKRPLGMGDALLSAKRYLDEEFLLVYGNQIDVGDFVSPLKKQGAPSLLVDKTDEPWEYGMLKLRGNRALGIVEKPKKAKVPSNIRASGLYLLNQDFIGVLEKTPKQEYQFEAALNTYMKQSLLEVVRAEEPVLQLKYAWDLFSLRDWLLEKLPEKQSRKAQIAKTATVTGKVIMEDGAQIFDHALVQGPVYLGHNSVVGAYSILRQGSILEEKAEIQRFVDCARSIIGPDSQIHTGFVGDSILGEGVRIGAGLITANRRIDRENIKVRVAGAWTDTKQSYMGALLGDEVKLGVNVTVMPGIAVGAGSAVGPNSVVMENIGPNSLFYTDYRKIATTRKLKSLKQMEGR